MKTGDDAGRTTLPDSSRFYTHPVTGNRLWSVSTIIEGTWAKPWLTDWSVGLSAKWCLDHMTDLARLLRDEGRTAALKYVAGEAERERLLKADCGTYVHDVQERLIYWAASPGRTGADIAMPILPEHLENALYHIGGDEYEPVTDVADHMVTGFMQFVTDFDPQIEAAEMRVMNLEIGVAGTLDAIMVLYGYGIGSDPFTGESRVVAMPGSRLILCVDTKTGKYPGSGVREQLAAYRRMTECLLPMGDIHPMPCTDAGAVLHLRPEHPGGYRLIIVSAADDEAAWQRFLKAASIFQDRQKIKTKPGRVLRPLRADGTLPATWIGDLDAEGYGRALSPLVKALGPDVTVDDLAQFTADDVLAVKGIGPKLLDVIRQMLADNDRHLTGETIIGAAPAAHGKAA
jgi:hypothetical protein